MNLEIDVRDVLPSVRVPTLVAASRRRPHPDRRSTLDGRADPGRAVPRAAGRPAHGLRRRLGARRRRDRAFRRPDLHGAGAGAHSGQRAGHDPLHGHRRLDRARRRARRSRLAGAARAAPRRRPPAACAVPRSGARHGRRRLLRPLRRAGARDPVRHRDQGGGGRHRPGGPGRPPHRRVRDPGRQGRGDRRLDRRSGRGAGRGGGDPRLADGQGPRGRLGDLVRATAAPRSSRACRASGAYSRSRASSSARISRAAPATRARFAGSFSQLLAPDGWGSGIAVAPSCS